MDIISHAVAGAASGAIFGRPLLGAAVAITPDLALGLKRKALPTALYRFTHSLGFVWSVSALCLFFTDDAIFFTVLLALVSHIALDIPTHGVAWAPRLLYPLTSTVVDVGYEWEWFNWSWWRGMCMTIIWSTVCLSLS